MKKSLNAKLFSILLASGFLIWVTSQNSAQAAGLVCYSLASGGAWSNPNTWGNSPVGVPGSCPGVPGVGDTAAIVGSGVVTVSGAVSVDVLSISDGTSLSGTSGGKVTILNASSPSTWTSSSFGFTLTDVEIELGTGTSLSIVGSGPATLAGNAKISALSGVTITQNLPISMSPTAEIKLSSGATLHAGADIFGDPAGTSKITNDGTINFNGINIGDVSFDNGGIINCDALCSISLSAANTFAMLMSPAVLSGDGQITKLNTLTLAAGTVSIKTITAPLVNNTGAQLNPSAGSTTVARSMTINGDYDQGILGSFRSYLYNSTRDLITVTGTANLGGFHLKGTFGPQQGTGYFHDVFTAGTLNIVGGFPANPGYGFTGDQNLFRTTSDAQSGNSFRITYTGSAYSVEDNGDVASPTLKTLRSAITDIANDSSCIGSPYKIIFYLPGGTIQPATPLPNLGTCVTTLDGFTNLGASADTNGARDASTAVYTFSLDGTSCGASCNGLRVAGPNSVEITGMHITNFATSAGIAVDPTAGITQLYGNKLVGNNFGVFHDGAPGLEIGADVVGKKNIIYSNLDSGIHSINQLASTTQSLFVNNLIGVTADGVTSAGNGNNGIWVNGSNEIFISASIIANSQKGVNITGTSQRVELDLNAAGGSPNVIYGNSIIGVDLNGDGPTPNDPAVALDADTGPNGLSNYAVITGVTFPTMTQTDVSISIAGKPSTQYEVLVCQNPPGESQCRNPLFSHLLLTNGAGIASTLVATAYYAPPWSATAIATALDGPEPGNSSEISPAFAVAAPDVTVAPATLTFSETNGNTTAPQTVTVTNSTALPITITSITPPPGFVIFSNSCGTTIPASPATCTLQIQYTASPTNTGGTLAINHSGGGSPTTVTVTGATAIPDVSATPAGLTFAGTVGNQSAAQTVTITNITMPPGTLNLSAFATTGPFSITGNTCGATLAAGASCTAMVAFTATGTGFIMGDAFSFMFNTFNASVALSGTGSQAPQTITGFAPATPVLLSSISQTLSATGGLSGNPIVFASTTPSTCTVAGNVLTYVLAGPCTVTAYSRSRSTVASSTAWPMRGSSPFSGANT